MDVAELKQSQKLRILNALDTIRETSYAIGGAVLKGTRAVREGRENDAAVLAEIIGQCEANWKLAQSIARELQ